METSIGTAVAWVTLAAGAAVALYHLRAGVLLWVATAATVVAPLAVVRHSTVRLCTAYLAVLLALWAAKMWRRRRIELPRSSLAVPLLVLAVVTIVSLLQGLLFPDPTTPGEHRFFAVQVYSAALTVLSVGAALLVGGKISREAEIRWLWGTVVGVGAALMVGVAIGFPTLRWWPIVSTQAAALIYARLLFDPSPSFWSRSLSAGLVVYALGHIVILPLLDPHGGQWLSGWAMLVVALAGISLVRLQRRMLIIALPAAVIAGYFLLPFLYSTFIAARLEGDFGRLFIWEDALRIWRARPVLGVGPGNYMDYAERYAQGPIAFSSAHGNYQEILVELGFVGLVVFLWVIVRAFVVGLRLAAETRSPFERSVVIAVLCGLAGQLVAATIGDYLLPAYHNGGHTNICVTIYTWVLIGALMSVDASVARASRAGPS